MGITYQWGEKTRENIYTHVSLHILNNIKLLKHHEITCIAHTTCTK